MGMMDLSAPRAEIVRRLNRAGVPVTAWQLLPKSQGYWFNLNNAAHAAARYVDFQAWTAQHDLHWDGIGLDIEFDQREIMQLLANRWLLLPTLLRRSFDNEGLRRGQVAYSALVAQMRADGYRVDSYLIPLILDERTAGASFLQRISGVVDIPADREIPMLYSSFLRPRGAGVLWSYAQSTAGVGVGSTGGGVQFEGITLAPPLTWEEFERDLRLARRWTNDIHVFSLEGCIEQGFLARLKGFDWEQPVTPPLEAAGEVERFRQGLRTALWLTAHPLTVFGGLLGVLWLFERVRRGGRD
jgi:hypothetical protein